MPKLVQNYKFLTIFALVLLIAGADLYKNHSFDESELLSPKEPKITTIFEGLDYLNEIRSSVGLTKFKESQNLKISAQNHANYLDKNSIKAEDNAHGESQALPHFTGQNPAERAVFAGYNSSFVSENLSHNQINFNSSIDSLMSAIYHRFGFLNYASDEIGVAQSGKIYVYNMGNHELNLLCKSGGDFGKSGYYVTGICSDKSTKIKEKTFKNLTLPNEPKFLLYPSKLPALAYFGGEIPDPLPACKITANPVSVWANDNLSLKMTDFKIFDGTDEIKDTILLDKNSDINAKFSQNQFALFAKNVFEFDKTYRAKFSYILNGKSSDLEWEFHTKTPEFSYFVLSGDEKIGVKSEHFYDVFIKPKHCNDTFSRYTYTTSPLLKAKVEYVGLNTIRLFISGFKGDKVDISLDNGVKFSVVLTTSSKDSFNILGLKPSFAIITALLAILAVILIFSLIKK